MDDQRWLERLRDALARRRLPAAYADRLAQELSDHFHDLTEEKMSTEALLERLGEPDQVADAARTEYRGGFFQRHRWLGVTAFVVLPFPLLLVGWALTLTVMGFAAELTDRLVQLRSLANGMTVSQEFAIHLVLSAAIMLPAALLARLYVFLARRTGTRQRWAVIAGVVLAVFAGSMTSQLHLSEEPGKSSLMLGLGVGRNYTGWQISQFMAPLAVACLYGRSRKLPQATL